MGSVQRWPPRAAGKLGKTLGKSSVISVTRLGNFWKTFSHTFYKVSPNIWQILGCLEKLYFLSNNCYYYLFGMFHKNMVSSYYHFNIWSHCGPVIWKMEWWEWMCDEKKRRKSELRQNQQKSWRSKPTVNQWMGSAETFSTSRHFVERDVLLNGTLCFVERNI